jgi:hypothetical protein
MTCSASKARNLKFLGATYWRPYGCFIDHYICADHPSGYPHLICRYGEGYCGPYLPIVDGMPEFATGLPKGMPEGAVVDRWIFPIASAPGRRWHPAPELIQ